MKNKLTTILVVLILGLLAVIMQHYNTISKQKIIIEQQTQSLILYKAEKKELEKNLEEEKRAFNQFYADSIKSKKELELQKNEIQEELKNSKCAGERLPDRVIERLHKLTTAN